MRGIAIPDIDVVGGKVVQMRRRSKFGNRRTPVGELTFDSAREAKRWGDLVLLERIGEISDLRRQVAYPLTVNGILTTTYVADFVFVDKCGRTVVEDSKGVQTDAFKIKRRLMLAVHGVDVVLS